MRLRKQELWSKLTDGVLAAAMLVLLWLVVMLSVKPIQTAFATPGLLVYALGLLAVAMFAFQQSLVARHSDVLRAWYGICGGFLSWSVAEVCGYLGVPVLPSPASLVLLIMVILIVAVMWRGYLPLGARFFSLTFLVNWSERFLMEAQEYLAGLSPVFTLIYRATGYIAVILAIAALGWILFHTRRRIHRISGALVVWFMVSLALYVFRGGLF